MFLRRYSKIEIQCNTSPSEAKCLMFFDISHFQNLNVQILVDVFANNVFSYNKYGSLSSTCRQYAS